MKHPKLSILIPSLSDRATKLLELVGDLHHQAEAFPGAVEILIDQDDGGMPTGTKRNRLIASASGQYVVFIDDDDRVAPDYLEQLMNGIDQEVDVVSIQGIRTVNGTNAQRFIDRPYTRWSTSADGVFLRGVQHLDAVRTEIARRFPYPDISWGEDAAWGRSVEAAGAIATHYQVPEPIYFYLDREPKPRPQS